MIPYKYTVKDGVTTFHYKLSDLRWFMSEGLKNGNVGMVITNREGVLLTFKGFGTFNNPMYKKHTFCIKHLEWINGTMPTDDQRLIPPKPMVFTQSIVMPRNEEFKPLRRNKV